MTDTTMNCKQLDGVLASYLEGELDRRTRAAVDAHLGSCLRCASLARDLWAIAGEAAELPELTPSRDLWSGIAERIETPIIPLAQRAAPRTWSNRPARLAAAAVILVAATAGTTYLFTRSSNPRESVTRMAATGDTALQAPDSGASGINAPVTTQSSRTGAATPVARQKDASAVVTYDREITALRGVLDLRRNDLDPATVAVLEHSLQTIDHAIADARAAIAKDSASVFLHDQLNQALEKKLGLLRTVALLPPRA